MKKTLSIALFSLLLVACSGGGGDTGAKGTDTGMVWDQGNFDEKNWQ